MITPPIDDVDLLLVLRLLCCFILFFGTCDTFFFDCLMNTKLKRTAFNRLTALIYSCGQNYWHNNLHMSLIVCFICILCVFVMCILVLFF